MIYLIHHMLKEGRNAFLNIALVSAKKPLEAMVGRGFQWEDR